MEQTQSSSSGRRRDLVTVSLLLRVILGGLLSAVVLIAFAFLLSSSKPSITLSVPNLLIRVVSGIFYVAVMAPLARQVFYRRFPRFLAIFVPLYITGALTDL